MELEEIKAKWEGGYKPKYIGVSDIAQIYWCHQKAVFNSLNNEPLVKNKVEDLKEKGFGLGEYEVEEVEKPERWYVLRSSEGNWAFFLDFGKGNLVWVDVSADVIEELGITPGKKYKERPPLELLDEHIWTLMSGVSGPLARGLWDEIWYAEVRSRTIAYFAWRDYTLLAEPDGITNDLCYEFKSSNLVRFTSPIAKAQANLYSYFFKRESWRAQVRMPDKGKVYTYEARTDVEKAENDLVKFDRLLKREMEPWPPQGWKCRTCRYHPICALQALSKTR